MDCTAAVAAAAAAATMTHPEGGFQHLGTRVKHIHAHAQGRWRLGGEQLQRLSESHAQTAPRMGPAEGGALSSPRRPPPRARGQRVAERRFAAASLQRTMPATSAAEA